MEGCHYRHSYPGIRAATGKMPSSPATTTLVLIRTIRRLMSLHRPKVTDQGLALIPHTAKVTSNSQETRWDGGQGNRDKPRPCRDVRVRNILLLSDIFYLTKVRTDGLNITIILFIGIVVVRRQLGESHMKIRSPPLLMMTMVVMQRSFCLQRAGLSLAITRSSLSPMSLGTENCLFVCMRFLFVLRNFRFSNIYSIATNLIIQRQISL